MILHRDAGVRRVGVALAVSLGLAGAAAGQSPAPASPASGEPTPTAGRVAAAVLTDDKEKKPAKDVFAPDTAKIYVIVSLADTPRRTVVKAVWIAEKAHNAPPEYHIDEAEVIAGGIANEVTFSLSRPNTGWPEGAYRVELSLAGAAAKTLRFRVAPAKP